MTNEAELQFKTLLGQSPTKVILKFFPLVEAGAFREANACVGFAFNGGEAFFVETDPADDWTPVLLREEVGALTKVTTLPEGFWVVATEEEADYQYLDVSRVPAFGPFVGAPIERVEWVSAEGATGPFGVRISNGSASLISISSGSGNTFETDSFNEGVVDIYDYFGRIQYRNI
jgi:hypothetical protein